MGMKKRVASIEKNSGVKMTEVGQIWRLRKERSRGTTNSDLPTTLTAVSLTEIKSRVGGRRW